MHQRYLKNSLLTSCSQTPTFSHLKQEKELSVPGQQAVQDGEPYGFLGSLPGENFRAVAQEEGTQTDSRSLPRVRRPSSTGRIPRAERDARSRAEVATHLQVSTTGVKQSPGSACGGKSSRSHQPERKDHQMHRCLVEDSEGHCRAMGPNSPWTEAILVLSNM